MRHRSFPRCTSLYALQRERSEGGVCGVTLACLWTGRNRECHDATRSYRPIHSTFLVFDSRSRRLRTNHSIPCRNSWELRPCTISDASLFTTISRGSTLPPALSPTSASKVMNISRWLDNTTPFKIVIDFVSLYWMFTKRLHPPGPLFR